MRQKGDTQKFFMAAAEQDQHLVSLDIIRAFACLFIMFGHFVTPYYVGYSVVRTLFGVGGHLGITMFLFVSGYGLAKKYDPQQSPFAWLKKRAIRIYPPLWIFTINALGYSMIFFGLTDLKSELVFNFMGLNGLFLFATGHAIFAEHTWFITLIVIFYILFPYIFEIFNGTKISMAKKAYLLVLIYGVSVFLQVQVNTGPYAFFLCVPPFFFGILFSLFPPQSMADFCRKKKWLISFMLLLLLLFDFWAIKMGGELSILVIPIYPLLCFPVVFLWCEKWRSKFFLGGIAWVSSYSYEIYLYHPLTMREHYSVLWPDQHSIVIALLYSIVATSIAVMLAQFVSCYVRNVLSRVIHFMTGY